MRARAGLLAAAILLTTSPSVHAEGTAGLSVGQTVALNGAEVLATVAIEPGPGETLGSYGATLQWDPAVLHLEGYTGGTPPFDTPVVNLDVVGEGRIQFADAAPAAPPGLIEVIHLHFQPLALPPATTVLDVEFSSLFGGQTFQDLLPEIQVEDSTVCVPDFAYDLAVRGATETFLEWSPIPTGVSYDVIRGNVEELSTSGPIVNLGTVLCLENNSADTTTDSGTEPANPDTAVPLVGTGFFYLIRFFDGTSDSTLGFTPDCVSARVPSTNVCD